MNDNIRIPILIHSRHTQDYREAYSLSRSGGLDGGLNISADTRAYKLAGRSGDHPVGPPKTTGDHPARHTRHYPPAGLSV
ncbi:hypothetical protein J6590_043472 [Homalodisca vitripennis]|nr:hypothetical protein J6590_043472 [Homalodisca vitripennis]